jgi:hypothetical protein
MFLFSSSLRRKSSCFTYEHYKISSLATLSSAAVFFFFVKVVTCHVVPWWNIPLYFSVLHFHKNKGLLIVKAKRKTIPVLDLRATGDGGSQNFRTIDTWRCQVCQPYGPAVFTFRKYPWYSFSGESVDSSGIERQDGLSQWKILMILSEIETTTFRLVAQCLTELRYPMHHW